MYSWGYKLSPVELAPIARAADSLRTKWNSINPPWQAAFDFTVTDVRALDYMDYEGVTLPKDVGVEGAALICGEVLRRAAKLDWFQHYGGEWLIASPEIGVPDIAICPVARLHEIKAKSPKYGNYMQFLQLAALECLRQGERKIQDRMRQLIFDSPGRPGESVEYLQHLLTFLHDPNHNFDG